MSFKLVNGRQIEILDDYPDFFEPKPVSPKRKSNQPLFVDSTGNIHIEINEIRKKPVLRRRTDTNYDFVSISAKLPSVLGKRNNQEAFGIGNNDSERYGQTISPDFFKTNVGHDVRCNYYKPMEPYISSSGLVIDEAEILDWCAKYLANKNK